MKVSTITKRVKKTKYAMRDALVKLLETKTLSEIRTTDLCELAGINRSTFYCHYSSLEEFYSDVQSNFINQLPEKPVYSGNVDYEEHLAEVFNDYFEYIHKNSRVFKALLNTNSYSFIKEFEDKVLANYSPSEGSSYYLKMGFSYAVTGIIGMIDKWIEDGFKVSDKEFAKIAIDFCKLVTKFAKEGSFKSR